MFTTVILFGLGITAVVVGTLYARSVYRRTLADSAARTTFTLQDLREMRASGEISEREYQTLRAAIIGELDQAPVEPPGD